MSDTQIRGIPDRSCQNLKFACFIINSGLMACIRWREWHPRENDIWLFREVGKVRMWAVRCEPVLVFAWWERVQGLSRSWARKRSSQQQKHRGDKNWPNPSGCQSLTGQVVLFTSHESEETGAQDTWDDILDPLVRVTEETQMEMIHDTSYRRESKADWERIVLASWQISVFSVLENNKSLWLSSTQVITQIITETHNNTPITRDVIRPAIKCSM